METLATARKWGNSVGITIPPEVLAKEKIQPNDQVVVSVRKVTPIIELFGTFKTKKSAQQIKDEMRKGWG